MGLNTLIYVFPKIYIISLVAIVTSDYSESEGHCNISGKCTLYIIIKILEAIYGCVCVDNVVPLHSSPLPYSTAGFDPQKAIILLENEK